MTAIIYYGEDSGLYGYEIQCDGYSLFGTADSFDVAVTMAKEDGATTILDHTDA